MQQGLQTPNGAFWKLEKRFWECRHRISPLSRAEGGWCHDFFGENMVLEKMCRTLIHSSKTLIHSSKVLIHSSKLNYTLIHSSKNQLHTHPLIQKPTTHSSTHPKDSSTHPKYPTTHPEFSATQQPRCRFETVQRTILCSTPPLYELIWSFNNWKLSTCSKRAVFALYQAPNRQRLTKV